jgi:L-fucose isomerase-like protein
MDWDEQMIQPRIGCYVVYEPTEEGWENYQATYQEICTRLETQGAKVLSAPEAVSDEASCRRVSRWLQAQTPDLLMALIITWSFDHYSYLILQENPLPIAIRCVPGIRTGSIVGGQQLGSLLTDLRLEHRLFYGEVDEPQIQKEILTYARACAVLRLLKGKRIAIIGHRTHGMTPIAVDEVEIMRLFGMVVTNIGLDEFTALTSLITEEETISTWHRITSKATTANVDPFQALQTIRYYLTMKNLVIKSEYVAVTFGSYPFCQGTACLPLALLNDEGIPAGCEGDLNSTLAMYILFQLSGQPVHFGEMLAVDEQENTLITSHCGAGAPSLAENGFILCPVRLGNRGVCIRYTARPGPVTFVNLVGRKGTYRLCAFEGEAISTSLVFEGTPLKMRYQTPFRSIWKVIDKFGFGHHWMTAYQHVSAELCEICRLAGIQGVFPDQREVKLGE